MMKYYLLLLAALIASKGVDAALNLDTKKFVLDNGLRLYVHEDHKAPIVSVAVWYDVGSKDERDGRRGFAHLFEHLMFNGSENYDKDYFKALLPYGVTDLNGTTSQDRTNYFQTVPKAALDRLLWLESDRMGHLLPAIDLAKLDEQREVVKNEKRQSEASPFGSTIYHEMDKLAYPEAHPYHHPIIGYEADLNAASVEDAHAWFKEYYGASNAVIVIAGDITALEAYKKVQHYFSFIQSGASQKQLTKSMPKDRVGAKIILPRPVQQERVYMTWHMPAFGDEGWLASNILGDLLAGDQASYLYQELVNTQKIATNVSSFYYDRRLAGLMYIIADPKPGISGEMLETAIKKALQKWDVEKTASEDNLARLVTASQTGFIRGLEKIGGMSGKANFIARGVVYMDNPNFYGEAIDQLAAITTDEVVREYNTWLTKSPNTVIVVPAQTVVDVTEDFADRSKIPVPDIVADSNQNHFDQIQSFQLSTGLPVELLSRHHVPLISMTVTFDGGDSSDLIANKPGLTNFVLTLLEEGGGVFESDVFKMKLDRLGASFSASSNYDQHNLSLSVPADKIAPLMDLLTDLLEGFSAKNDKIKQLKARFNQSIQQSLSEPSALAARALPALLYGADDPYGKLNKLGYLDTIDSIRAEEIESHFKRVFSSVDAVLVVGDITQKALSDILEDSFLDDLSVTKNMNSTALKSAMPAAQNSSLYIIDLPGNPQTRLMGATRLQAWSIENKAIDWAANKLLGGEFTARLNMRLREKEGWSYGAKSELYDTKRVSPWVISTSVQADKSALSLQAIAEELHLIQTTQKAKQATLDNAVQKNRLAEAGRFETNDAWLGRMALLNRLSVSYEDYAKQQAALTDLKLEQVQKRLNQTDFADWAWVLVGDAKMIRDQITEIRGSADFKRLPDAVQVLLSRPIVEIDKQSLARHAAPEKP